MQKTIFIIVLIIGLLGISLAFLMDAKSRTPNINQIDLLKNIDTNQYGYILKDTITPGPSNICAMTINNDRLYLVADKTLSICKLSGKLIKSIALESKADCLAVDDDIIYLGYSNIVYKLDQNGFKKLVTFPRHSSINALAIGKDKVFMTDVSQRVVWQKSANKLEIIQTERTNSFIVPSPYFDLKIDKKGFLWIVNPGRHRIDKYNQAGEYISSWGKGSLQLDGFCGCCNPVYIDILSDGSFITSEKGLQRVKKYDVKGVYECVVAILPENKNSGLNLAVDSEDHVYVLSTDQREIMVYETRRWRCKN